MGIAGGLLTTNAPACSSPVVCARSGAAGCGAVRPPAANPCGGRRWRVGRRWRRSRRSWPAGGRACRSVGGRHSRPQQPGGMRCDTRAAPGGRGCEPAVPSQAQAADRCAAAARVPRLHGTATLHGRCLWPCLLRHLRPEAAGAEAVPRLPQAGAGLDAAPVLLMPLRRRQVAFRRLPVAAHGCLLHLFIVSAAPSFPAISRSASLDEGFAQARAGAGAAEEARACPDLNRSVNSPAGAAPPPPLLEGHTAPEAEPTYLGAAARWLPPFPAGALALLPHAGLLAVHAPRRLPTRRQAVQAAQQQRKRCNPAGLS